jgi:hypothetical protein
MILYATRAKEALLLRLFSEKDLSLSHIPHISDAITQEFQSDGLGRRKTAGGTSRSARI